MSSSVPGPTTTGATGVTTPGPSSGSADTRSLGEIVGSVTQDLSTLVRQEIELARTEFKEEIARAGKGAGLLGGAGVIGNLVLFLVSLTAIFALDEGLELWLAALIVTVVWAIVAAVLALVGKKAIDNSNPQLPKTQQTLKEDAQWAKAQKS